MSPQTNIAEYNEYMRKYVLERHHRTRRWAIQHLGGKCVLCGSTENLQFDHIDPETKSFTICKSLAISRIRLLAELKKCQLLCHTCHNKKTLKENGLREAKGNHGTVSTYRYCKCKLCKKAWNDCCTKYRKTHPRKKKSANVIGRVF